MNADKNTNSFEVLSPWADADPVPWKGINERLEGVSNKTIGLLRNSKRTAEPTLKVLEDRLKKRFPTATFNWFSNLKPNETAAESEFRDEFEKWLDGVDAIILSYGD